MVQTFLKEDNIVAERSEEKWLRLDASIPLPGASVSFATSGDMCLVLMTIVSPCINLCGKGDKFCIYYLLYLCAVELVQAMGICIWHTCMLYLIQMKYTT